MDEPSGATEGGNHLKKEEGGQMLGKDYTPSSETGILD